jgi:hypothetical protein
MSAPTNHSEEDIVIIPKEGAEFPPFRRKPNKCPKNERDHQESGQDNDGRSLAVGGIPSHCDELYKVSSRLDEEVAHSSSIDAIVHKGRVCEE